jgi:hypothetical protein
VTDFLTEKRLQIADRLKELEPLVEEHRRLEAAASALAKLGASAPATVAATPRRRPGRPRGSTNRASQAAPAASPPPTPAATPVKAPKKAASRKKPGRPRGRVGRRKGSGTRAAQALATVRDSPESRSPSSPPRWGSRRRTSIACSLGWSRRGRWRRGGGGGFLGRGRSGLAARVVTLADRRGGLRWARAAG